MNQAWILCAYENRFEPCAADRPVYRIWSEPEPRIDFRVDLPRWVDLPSSAPARSVETAWARRYRSPVLGDLLLYVAEKDHERANKLVSVGSCVVLFLMWLFAEHERQRP